MKRIYLWIIALLITLPTFAQENNISWKGKVEKLGDGLYELQAVGTLQDGWHIYDLGPYKDGPNATTFTIDLKDLAQLEGTPYIKSNVHKELDEVWGMEIGTCEGTVIIAQKVKLLKGDATALQGSVEWQACCDGACTAPEEETITFNLKDGVTTAQSTPVAANSAAATPAAATPAKEDAKSEATIGKDENKSVIAADGTIGGKKKSLWALILEAIAWGFVALLTPCVFPMIPMTVSFFLKKSQNKARGRFFASFFGFFIVALYTLPIAIIILITYIAGGDAVTASIFNWLATHWIPNIIFFAIFMIFAASFFGAFEITLPSWMSNKSDENSEKGGLVGVFFIALTLVLVSFSCTGPIVGTVLIKSTQGEIWEPIITMLAFSIAFALPFTIFAFAPSLLKSLPKSGGWLNSVKVVLGFIEVALGFKFLSVADQTYHWHLLDREVYLAIWIVVFFLLGLYLLGKIRFVHDSPNADKPLSVFRLILVIVDFTFVVYMIPGMWGAPLKALSGYLPPITTQDFVLGAPAANAPQAQTEQHYMRIDISKAIPSNAKYSDFLHLPHNLHGFFDYNEAVEYAKRVGKPIFLDITGHGCVNCREMEMRVWSDERVLKHLNEDFVMLCLYIDDKTQLPKDEWITLENGKVLKTLGSINSHFVEKRYNASTQPFYILLNPETQDVLLPPRKYDLDVPGFIKFLEDGLAAYNKNK